MMNDQQNNNSGDKENSRRMFLFEIDNVDLPEFIRRFQSFALDVPTPNETLNQEFTAQLLTQSLLQKFRLRKT